ncbi:MAG: general secretion pathway protein GspC [Bdellovibrionaceae bacterium]|nr:general secretion pathway protein GspC [Pseudobdellovibrionaceae bacterium]
MDKTNPKKTAKRPPLEGLYPYIVFLFLGYCIADLVVLELRGSMIPNSVPPSRQMQNRPVDMPQRGTFTPITSRNIFTEDGSIPDALAVKQAKTEQKEEPKDAAPVLSSLPLGLVGTIVHSNPAKSIANIEVRPKSTVIAVRPNQEIDTLAVLVSVERGKIIIRNSNNSRLEYIELKNLSKLSFNAPKAAAPGAPATGSQDVQMVGQNKFEVKRSDILKYTSNMSQILQDAAMQPSRKASGEIDGFKFMSIKPGSIYSQLGFQIGDKITCVNDEPVDSPAKAMEMYNTLKGSSSIKICIERDGRKQDFDYTVK